MGNSRNAVEVPKIKEFSIKVHGKRVTVEHDGTFTKYELMKSIMLLFGSQYLKAGRMEELEFIACILLGRVEHSPKTNTSNRTTTRETSVVTPPTQNEF